MDSSAAGISADVPNSVLFAGRGVDTTAPELLEFGGAGERCGEYQVRADGHRGRAVAMAAPISCACGQIPRAWAIRISYAVATPRIRS